jgi:hypothetical protein
MMAGGAGAAAGGTAAGLGAFGTPTTPQAGMAPPGAPMDPTAAGTGTAPTTTETPGFFSRLFGRSLPPSEQDIERRDPGQEYPRATTVPEPGSAQIPNVGIRERDVEEQQPMVR